MLKMIRPVFTFVLVLFLMFNMLSSPSEGRRFAKRSTDDCSKSSDDSSNDSSDDSSEENIQLDVLEQTNNDSLSEGPVCPVTTDPITDLVSGPNGIVDDAITSSSDIAAPALAPWNGRLDNSDLKHWMSPNPSPGEYLQFRFSTLKCLTGIITQGSGYDINPAYVTYYSLLTSPDCSEFTVYENLTGNIDASSYASHTFSTPVSALCVRVAALEWVSTLSLRVALMGYDAQI